MGARLLGNLYSIEMNWRQDVPTNTKTLEPWRQFIRILCKSPSNLKLFIDQYTKPLFTCALVANLQYLPEKKFRQERLSYRWQKKKGKPHSVTAAKPKPLEEVT